MVVVKEMAQATSEEKTKKKREKVLKRSREGDDDLLELWKQWSRLFQVFEQKNLLYREVRKE